MYAWRVDMCKPPTYLKMDQAEIWPNYEINIRRIAGRKKLSEECPFKRPIEIANNPGILPGTKGKPKLGIKDYEFFYLSEEDFSAVE